MPEGYLHLTPEQRCQIYALLKSGHSQAHIARRMMKLRQKISGGFRSVAGAADFAVIRSLLATARKQGWKMLDTLATDPTRLLADLKSA